ncbi:MAG: right-handed parallel beta-helix repeat-containing protein [Acidobacteria bacterium]|nr:right-handed parallel beta-helix repeat-containing protein [Acidobacteriota bacterium]
MRASSEQQPYATETPVTEFYLSPSGNDSNPGTKEAPFSSFKKADSVVQPGDTVHVLPGEYNGYTAQNTIRIGTSGVESARIRWVAETKWAARIVGHVNPENHLGWGIVVAGNYVDLVDFDVTSNANMGIWVLGTHVRVIGNHVHDIPGRTGCSSYGASGIEQGNYQGGYMEVIANVVHNVGAGGPGSCNKYHGIYLAAPFDTAVNNISYHNASKGIGTWHAATNNTISNNTVFENDVGILVGAGDSPCHRTCLADYMVVSNNIMYHNRTIGFWEYSRAGRHNVYTNNLSFANRDRNILLQGCIKSGATCNSFDKAVFANPRFINPTGNFFTGDYHLKRTSPALKAGRVMDAPETDFEGRPRTAGLAPDLGAYQSDEQLAKKAN